MSIILDGTTGVTTPGLSSSSNASVTGTLGVTGAISTTDTTASSSATTGALKVSGGAGFAKGIVVGSSSNRGSVTLIGTSGAGPVVDTTDNQTGGKNIIFGQGVNAGGEFDVYNATDNVNMLRITSAGAASFVSTLKVSTGAAVGGATPGAGGLAFPATAVAVADVNTLDDYEEGSWTPTDSSGASLSFSNTLSTYTKIGRAVWLQTYFSFPGTANLANISIGGLPFTAAANAYATGVVSTNSPTSTGLYVRVEASTTTCILIIGNTNANNSSLSGAYCIFTLVYGT